MTVGLALVVSDGLDAEREANDIVRVFRLGKTDTVMSCLGDRFQDARVLINTMASSSGPITCRTCSQDIVHVQSALDELPKRFRPNVKVEYGHAGGSGCETVGDS